MIIINIDTFITVCLYYWTLSALDILVNDLNYSYPEACKIINAAIDDYLNGLGSSVNPSK